MPSPLDRRLALLGTAHFVVALLSLASGLVLALVWLSGQPSEVPPGLAVGQLAFQAAAAFYLLATSVTQYRAAVTLRAGQPLSAWPYLAVGQLLALAVALLPMVRGPAARIYMAQLDLAVAVLVTVSALSLAALAGTLWQQRRLGADEQEESLAEKALWPGFLQLAASFLLAAAAAWLETRPL